MRTASAIDPASRLEFFTSGLLDSLVATETKLRLDYRSITVPKAPEGKVREFIGATTAFLELFYFLAVATEVAHRHGIRTAEDIASHRDDFFAELRALTKLSLDTVLNENAAHMAALRSKLQSDTGSALMPELEKAVSAATSILRTYPVNDLIEIANALDMAEFGSRCQLAYAGLEQFIRRNDEWIEQRVKVVGVEYTLGKTSIEEAATVLELPVAEAVALLEDHGYWRPLENVALDEEARSALYDRLRQSRLARSGKPAPNASRTTRAVVASQRIEGIDARPWVDSKLL